MHTGIHVLGHIRNGGWSIFAMDPHGLIWGEFLRELSGDLGIAGDAPDNESVEVFQCREDGSGKRKAFGDRSQTGFKNLRVAKAPAVES